jgi:hypothetical protein
VRWVSELGLFDITRKMSTPKRFKVTVSTVHRKTHGYTVCTLLDERKALALAAQVHLQRMPEDRLYEVLSVEPLDGCEANPEDIVDRLEW